MSSKDECVTAMMHKTTHIHGYLHINSQILKDVNKIHKFVRCVCSILSLSQPHTHTKHLRMHDYLIALPGLVISDLREFQPCRFFFSPPPQTSVAAGAAVCCGSYLYSQTPALPVSTSLSA